jgi:E3 ubiquitin-protein ligase EDD1
LDINANHAENLLLESESNASGNSNSAQLEEDSFRLSRRFIGRINSSTSSSSSSSAATATAPSLSGTATIPPEPGDPRDARKSSYRLKEHRWYDSYRDSHREEPGTTGGSSSPSTYRDLFASSSNLASHISRHSNNNATETCNNQNTADSNSANAKAKDTQSSSKNSGKKASLVFSSTLQYWTDSDLRFVKMAGMHSELVCICTNGQLHQWKWSSDSPYSEKININNTIITIHHPKTLLLDLVNEKIAGLDASSVRASVWTETAKIASWLDDSLDSPLTAKFQTPAQQLVDPEMLQLDKIAYMSTCNLFTLLRSTSGSIYWCGIVSYDYRAKLFDKYQSKLLKYKSSSGGSSEMAVGSYVSLKSLPVYSIGTLGFTIKDGLPLLGELTEQVFNYRDTTKMYRFKLRSLESLKENNGFDSVSGSGNYPDLATNCEQQLLQLHGSLKRKKMYASTENLANRKNGVQESGESGEEDFWYLSDVVFLEETKASNVLGKVIKVDADFVLVKMQSAQSSDGNESLYLH